MHEYMMQIVDKKFCHVGLLQLELGQELIVLSQKFVYGLITLTAYISCSILLFSQIQKEVAMPNTSSSWPEKFSSIWSSE